MPAAWSGTSSATSRTREQAGGWPASTRRVRGSPRTCPSFGSSIRSYRPRSNPVSASFGGARGWRRRRPRSSGRTAGRGTCSPG
jgi:hypothetical protein